MNTLLHHVFAKLARRRDLTVAESREVFELIMAGRLEPAAVGALLGALAAKGEAVDELVGAALAMRASALPIRCDAECVDTCGTGGDGSSTFNVSTAAAIVAAAAGATVAKHGNRSTTRASGSTEVLGELGLNVEAPPAAVERSLREIRIGYLNARTLQPAMKHAAPVRQAIPIRTIFNLLGPLTNPAGARRHLLGVPRPELVPLMAEALAKLDAVHAWVVHGLVEAHCGGAAGAAAGPAAHVAETGREPLAAEAAECAVGICDVTTTGRTIVAELNGGRIRQFSITPEQVGMPRHSLEQLLVRSPAESAAVIRGVLNGEPGAARNQTILNAGAALVVAQVAQDLPEGISLARQAIDAGRARQKLNEWVRLASEESLP